MWMTTLSCVSTEFGGFLKDSLIVFQTAPECSTELDGKFRTNVPDDEVIGQIKSVKSRVSAITSCDLLQIYYKFATHNTE